MAEHLYTMIIVKTYGFVLLKTRFVYVIKSPTSSRYTVQILFVYHSGTHLLILNLKVLKDSDSFISLGTKSHIFGRIITHKVFEACELVDHRKSLVSTFQEFLVSINKMSILAGRLGTRLAFYEFSRLSWICLMS